MIVVGELVFGLEKSVPDKSKVVPNGGVRCIER